MIPELEIIIYIKLNILEMQYLKKKLYLFSGIVLFLLPLCLTGQNQSIVYGSILIQKSTADHIAIPTSEIPFTDIGSRFRVVNDWAVQHGYFSGFPNFHQSHNGVETVYGTILIKKGAADHIAIPASEIPFTDIGSRFRAVNDWAVKHGYAAGYPNFHQAHNGTEIVYGAILLKKGSVICKDISEFEIPFKDLGSRFRAVNDWAVNHGYFSGFPNFHQALRIRYPMNTGWKGAKLPIGDGIMLTNATLQSNGDFVADIHLKNKSVTASHLVKFRYVFNNKTGKPIERIETPVYDVKAKRIGGTKFDKRHQIRNRLNPTIAEQIFSLEIDFIILRSDDDPIVISKTFTF